MKPLTDMLKVLVIVGLMGWAPARPVLAGGVVGSGTPGSCSEAALATALAGGGSVSFNCGAAPVTIGFTSAKSIVTSTTIDGGGSITLSGQDSTRLFAVSNGATLTLRNIVLTNGYSADNGGAIHNGALSNDTPGVVVLENSTIRNSVSSLSGGAIVSTGPLTITNSLLEHNAAINGGALFPRFGAVVRIQSSTLRDNRATGISSSGLGGAMLIWDGAHVTLQNTDVISNTGNYGGGLYMIANTRLDVSGGSIRDNTSANTAGALASVGGTAVLTDVVISDNTALSGSGVLVQGGATTISRSAISGNKAVNVGAGMLISSGSAALSAVTFQDNTAQQQAGGGLYLSFGSAQITNATFAGNAANTQGGAIFVNDGILSLTHTTFSDNNAGGQGGAIAQANTSVVTVRASILAAGTSGGNCFGTITNGGFNLSTDATCAGFNQVADAMLDPLANNGGTGWTQVPRPGSPAIDLVAVNCPPPAVDQRGFARPMDGNGDGTARCDAGAVERQSVGPELLLRVFLPALTR